MVLSDELNLSDHPKLYLSMASNSKEPYLYFMNDGYEFRVMTVSSLVRKIEDKVRDCCSRFCVKSKDADKVIKAYNSFKEMRFSEVLKMCGFNPYSFLDEATAFEFWSPGDTIQVNSSLVEFLEEAFYGRVRNKIRELLLKTLSEL